MILVVTNKSDLETKYLLTYRMERIPAFILRNSHIGKDTRIWKRNHFSFCDSVHHVATNGTNFLSLCYKQHVVRPQKFNKSWTKRKCVKSQNFVTRMAFPGTILKCYKAYKTMNIPTMP